MIDITKEEIRTIPEFPDYGVTRDGRVYRMIFRNKQCDHPMLPRPIMPHSHNGYLRVTIRQNNHYKEAFVHRLVLSAFVGPLPEGEEVAHLNGTRADNRVENLIYATKKVNHSHKNLHGTMQRGERSAKAKLTDDQAHYIKHILLPRGTSQQVIADIYKVSRTTIEAIKVGLNWRHI